MTFDFNKLDYRDETQNMLFLFAEMGLLIGMIFGSILNGDMALPSFGMTIGILFGIRYIFSLIDYEKELRGFNVAIREERISEKILKVFVGDKK